MCVYGGVGNAQISVCGCCSVFRADHSSLDFTALQPRAAGSSFRSSGAAIHALCDSLHWRSPIGQRFHSRERQDGEGPASASGDRPLFCPTRVTFDWKIIKKKTCRYLCFVIQDTLVHVAHWSVKSSSAFGTGYPTGFGSSAGSKVSRTNVR